MDMEDVNLRKGHRERLRQRFVKGDRDAHTDEAILELLLTYAIPQKDVRPLSKHLINSFGSFNAVLSANLQDLCKVDGIKEYSAILINLANIIRKNYPLSSSALQNIKKKPTLKEADNLPPYNQKDTKSKETKTRQRTGIFGEAILKEAIAMLPKLPDTDSLSEIRQFLISNLHFSAEQTRQRNTSYITQRMFPNGIADKSLRLFARKYEGMQELRDVCFYRFCKAEPLMLDVISEIIKPAIGAGKTKRQRINEYLAERFPESKSAAHCAKSIVAALSAGGIVRADRIHLFFSYREILPHAFAFVIHSEFPDPGMHNLSSLEQNRHILTMLWNPTRILSTLYELRNLELISRISEIDNVRQFTTKLRLEELVTRITS
jgi:DNA repair protein RadC